MDPPSLCGACGAYWACKCAQEMDEKEWLEAIAQLDDLGLDIIAWRDDITARDTSREYDYSG